MSIKKHLVFFTLKFAIAYTILLLPPFRTLYADAFNATGNKWFRFVGDKGLAIFRGNESGTSEEIISEIRLMNKVRVAEANAKGITMIYDYGKVYCNWYGYLVIAYLLALIIATPIAIKRKAISFGIALLISYLYFLLMIWVLLLYKFNQNEQLDVLHLTGLSKTLVFSLYPVLVGNPGTTVFIAFLIYVLVVFRKGDLVKLKAAVVKPDRSKAVAST